MRRNDNLFNPGFIPEKLCEKGLDYFHALNPKQSRKEMQEMSCSAKKI